LAIANPPYIATTLPVIMKIEKNDIFEKLNMGEYIWGNAFSYSISGIDLKIKENQFNLLNEICKNENWNKLDDTWNPMDFKNCSKLLMDSLEFDMAYSEARITPNDVALNIHQNLLLGYNDSNCVCYSNWFNNHWRDREKGSSWNSLTDNTFDLSTVFIKQDKLLITCFRSED